MAHCKISSRDFIQNAFAPVIAVKCSVLVDQACQKNNLSFIELLQPFSKLNVEAQIRDSTGNAVTIKNLRMNFLNVNDAPPQPIVARQFLNSSVNISSDVRISTVTVNECSLQIPSSIPWFEVWRETFLRVQPPSDHEFTKHFLACMFVVSSSEPNPLDVLNELLEEITQSEHSSHSQLPKWFNTNVLRYIVVLHDTMEGKKDAAIKLIEGLKQQHGGHNCFLLQINSRSPGTVDENFLPDPWSQFLIKRTDSLELSDSDSPRNLIDTSGVTSMPTNVIHDPVSLESDCISSSSNLMGEKLEIGQEVNELNTFPSDFHPLTPDTENPEIAKKVKEDAFNLSRFNDWSSTGITPTVPHGACLTTNDVEQLKMLVNEFSLRSLLPYIEKQIQHLSDVISNKKGVSRSLFSATKRWFTPNKLGASGSVMQISTVTYASDSSEMQLRRLGDLYFMFGHYNMAFQIYHSAKRDFNADQAWPYYAGALEMAALSAFMCGEMTRKTCDYMEESITTYLYTCKLPQFATRATLLSTECLKDKGQYGEAAHQFIRMTTEDSDLGSALLLEQAAYCFLFCNKPKMVRKYAFHTVLSGHRFSKSMQRKHALRCYRQAFQIFKNKGWSLAEDHIYYTIGRQALFVKELQEAKDAFSKLLSPKSRQNAQQQAIFLKEYLNSLNVLMKSKSEVDKNFPVLSLFTLKGNDTKVLLGPQPPLKIPGRISASGVTFTSDEDDETNGKWYKLEQILVQEAFGPFGQESMIFKPMILLFSNKNSGSTQPVAIMSEPIQILVGVHNTLQIMLSLKDIYLLWEFTGTGETKVFNNEYIAEGELYNHVRTHKLDSTTLAPNSEEKLVLSITPLAVGKISIKGICYTVVDTQDTLVTVTGKQEFNIHGPKLAVKEKNHPEIYSEDNRLNIIVVPSASCLQVSFNELNQELLCNELQKISIEVRNCGSVPLHKIMMASSSPHLFSTTFLANESEIDDVNFENNKIKENRKHLIPFILPPQFNGKLEPGQSSNMNLWFRAPSSQGSSLVDLLFYYENLNSELIPRYRLVKHNWQLTVQSSLLTSMNTRKSKDCCQVDTLTFSLKATNCNQIHHAAVSEITLVQASLVSPDWKLHKNAIISTDVKLQTQESINFLLKATKDIKAISDAHYTDLMLSMHMKVYPEIKQPSINFANRILKNIYSNTINSTCRTIDSILILVWHALVTDSAGNKRNVIGQDFIPVDKSFNTENSRKPTNFLVSRNELALTASSIDHGAMSTIQQKISYNLAHLPLLVHNFKDNKICTVPMQLILHSNADISLIIKVNTISSSSDTTPFVVGTEIFTTNSSHNFRSIGRSDFQCVLEPSSSFKVPMMMAVTAPGTYELGDRIRIYCRTTSHKNDFLICKVQSVLIVRNTDLIVA